MTSGHVYLVGMPGSGKSTVGRHLARLLDMPFVDLDREVEEEAGQSIAEIFRHGGEARFRLLESTSLGRVASAEPSVVACGGGVVVKEANRSTLRQTGRVVYLHADPARLMEGAVVGSPARPLIRTEADLERLAAEREALYRDVADHVAEMEGRPSEVAQAVAGMLS